MSQVRPPRAASPLLEAHGLSRQYGASRVVDQVSLTLHPGETLGLVEPTAGTVHFRGVDLLALRPRSLRAMRRHMQIVFQDPFGALDPRMRIHATLAEPFAIHRDLDPTRTGPDGNPTPRAHRRARMDAHLTAMLAEVGLEPSALDRFPHEFSGGQRQRINIARALALAPELLVLDEPVSALDVSVSAQVINLLRDLQRARGLSYLFISHSMPLVRYLGDRIAVMQRGRIVETGPALEVCDRPREPYTRRLIAATPEINLPDAAVL